MATCTSVQSGRWSEAATWDTPPSDGDIVRVASGHAVWVDVDLGPNGLNWAGLAGLYVFGSRTPALAGTLLWKTGYSGYIVMADGSKLDSYGFDSQEPPQTNRGRILINFNGDWDDVRPLPFAYKAVVELRGSATVDCSWIEIRAYCEEPEIKYLEMYGDRYDFIAGPSTVNTATGYLDLGVTPPANGTAVRFKSLGGTLPGGINEDDTYFIYSQDGTSFRILDSYATNDWFNLIEFSSTGSGSVCMYTGFLVDGSVDTVNVWQDVSSDDFWGTGTQDGVNNFAAITTRHTGGSSLGGNGPVAMGLCIASKTASSITFCTGIEFAPSYAQNDIAPGAYLFLVSRNVMFYKSSGSALQSSVLTLCSNQDLQTETNIRCCVYGRTSGANGACVNGGYGAIVDGIVCGPEIGGSYSGCAGAAVGVGCTLRSILVNCSYNSAASGSTVSSLIAGCSYGLQLGNDVGYGDGGAAYFDGEIIGCKYALTQGGESAADNLVDGVIRHCYIGVYGAGSQFEGTVRSAVRYCRNAVSASDCAFNGTVAKCYWAFSDCDRMIAGGEIDSCNAAFNASAGKIARMSVTNCRYVFRACHGQIIANDLSDSGNISYFTIPGDPYSRGKKHRNITSFNHGGVSNALHVYGLAGTVTNETVVVPPLKTYSHKFTFQSDFTAPVFIEWDLMNFADTAVMIEVWAKNDTTGLMETQRINWAIVDRSQDPKHDPDYSYVDSFVSADSTAWQSRTLVCNRRRDQPLALRVWARRGSGNAYAYCNIVGAGGTSFGIVGTNVA